MNPIRRRPAVSIVMPVHNGAGFLRGALRSVLAQSFPDWELLVIDDGSTDGSAGIVSACPDPRLRILHQTQKGVAAARNLGIAAAKADLIAFLDADDRWRPHKLTHDVATLAAASITGPGIVYGSYTLVDEDYRAVGRSKRATAAGNVFEAVLEREGLMLPSAALVHRAVIEGAGGFDGACYHEDRAFFLRASRFFPAFPNPHHDTLYRLSPLGRCRSILADFNQAVAAELSIVAAVDDLLTADMRHRLTSAQLRFLACRFCMYGFIGHARHLWPRLKLRDLMRTPKGWLCLASLATGLDIMPVAARGAKATNRILMNTSRHDDLVLVDP